VAQPTLRDIATPHGPARAHLFGGGGRALVALGHGAGGGVTARDIVTVAEAALAGGCSVALVEQPYRVAGRRSAAPAAQLDAAWQAVMAALAPETLIAGGRSSGARVACRTAAATGAAGVVCLAFPVHPPGRPEKSRLPELDGVAVPVLVAQGESDPFGMPPDAPGRRVLRVPGDHSLRREHAAIAAAFGEWLEEVLS
jgi:predicted alpha/beta-hydrolase family hydrolase